MLRSFQTLAECFLFFWYNHCAMRSHHIPGLWVLTQAKKELTKLTGKALGSAA